MSETWLKEFKLIEFIFPDFVDFHSMRTNRRGIGVFVFINKKYEFVELVDVSRNFEHIECVFVEILHQNKSLVVGSCYRTPIRSNYRLFISDLRT